MAECLILGSGDKSFDANAAASDLLSGKTAYVKGVKVTGTMADRGQYQYAKSLGEGTQDGVKYWAFNGAPEGYYHNSGNNSWAPELRYPKEDLRKRLNIFPDTVRKGYTVGDITGTWYGNKAAIAAFAARGFGVSTSDYEAYNEASFTMPASGTVYYGGINCGYNVSSSKCQILKNGSVVDSRDFDGSNWRYGWRGTMINKSFSANAGDVIKVICAQESGTHGMSCIQAVIVY